MIIANMLQASAYPDGK